ncbi:PepSY-associated TM helix domain-containing protein [Apibacter adventoris]|uniref:PepSY-associated TM helix domain-containing protein n=1 Tax=Apibacter adventoris TaxID=1679466 RepID=UPI000CF68B26|nr:PepSY-associated TM helix domain-containing protein [Apibacter adventoris]PQL93870.1 PepSY domain-containing protein [Apibacter adventoris]
MKKIAKNKKTIFKKTISWLHLWPGIISAIILFFVCITGTVVVISDEVIDFNARHYLYVKNLKEKKIPIEKLLQKAQIEFPDYKLSYFITYRDKKRSVKVLLFNPKEGLINVFMDPYTGKVIGKDNTIMFFFVTAHLHASLLLGKTGEWIVDIASIIFLLELITGLILWWPKKWTKANCDKNFKIKWKAKWRRLNLDLHNVLGFYTIIFSIILVITGLIIAFKPLSNVTVKLFGGDPTNEWMTTLPKSDFTKKFIGFNKIIDKIFISDPTIEAIQGQVYNFDSIGYFMLTSAKNIYLKTTSNSKTRIYNKYTDKEILIPKPIQKQIQVENLNMMLHMGTWMGKIGKILTFIVGIIGSSLPLTGFLIWYGKKFKKRKFK